MDKSCKCENEYKQPVNEIRKVEGKVDECKYDEEGKLQQMKTK